MEIELGSYTIKSAADAPERLAALLWGEAGCGKTTLASTAPGRKLWLNFDDGGLSSVSGLRHTQAVKNVPLSVLNEEILVLDLSTERNNIIDKFKRDDGLNLSSVLSNSDAAIDTVVVDSTTRLGQMALEHVIAQGIHKSARIELPGLGSYGGRNALLLRMFVDVMNVTGKYKKHVIFISHEGTPDKNDDGVVSCITMALGGQLPQLTTQKLGEVWYMRDYRGKREIFLRPFQYYKPMKSRMFDLSTTKTSFEWKYDIKNPNPAMEIATWWKMWEDNGKQKIAVF